MSAIREVKSLERTVQSQKSETLYEKAVSQWEKVRADLYHRDSAVQGPSEGKIREILADTNPANHTRRLQAAAWALGFGANLGSYSIDGKKGYFTNRTVEVIKHEMNIFHKAPTQHVEEEVIERARDKMSPPTKEETALRQKAWGLWLRLNPRDSRQMEKLKDYVESVQQLRRTAESGNHWETIAAVSHAETKARALGIGNAFIGMLSEEATKINLGQKGELPGEDFAKLLRTTSQKDLRLG